MQWIGKGTEARVYLLQLATTTNTAAASSVFGMLSVFRWHPTCLGLTSSTSKTWDYVDTARISKPDDVYCPLCLFATSRCFPTRRRWLPVDTTQPKQMIERWSPCKPPTKCLTPTIFKCSVSSFFFCLQLGFQVLTVPRVSAPKKEESGHFALHGSNTYYYK